MTIELPIINLYHMASLTEQELQLLKEQLEKEAGELEPALMAAKKDAEFGSDIDHFDEEADEAEEFANNLGLRETLKERMADIELALEKMEKGGYGKCENCKNDISFEILKVNPESRLCKSCKSKK